MEASFTELLCSRWSLQCLLSGSCVFRSLLRSYASASASRLEKSEIKIAPMLRVERNRNSLRNVSSIEHLVLRFAVVINADVVFFHPDRNAHKSRASLIETAPRYFGILLRVRSWALIQIRPGIPLIVGGIYGIWNRQRDGRISPGCFFVLSNSFLFWEGCAFSEMVGSVVLFDDAESKFWNYVKKFNKFGI